MSFHASNNNTFLAGFFSSLLTFYNHSPTSINIKSIIFQINIFPKLIFTSFAIRYISHYAHFYIPSEDRKIPRIITEERCRSYFCLTLWIRFLIKSRNQPPPSDDPIAIEPQFAHRQRNRISRTVNSSCRFTRNTSESARVQVAEHRFYRWPGNTFSRVDN